MTQNRTYWSTLIQESDFVKFIDIILRGYSQVMLQNNPLTGLFFFMAINIGAYVEGKPIVAIGAFLGTIIATITGMILSDDKEALHTGIYGFNGTLVGSAIFTFLIITPFAWVALIIGAILSTLLFIQLSSLLHHWGRPPLTAPFILATWIFLLASQLFHTIALEPHLISTVLASPHSPNEVINFAEGFIKSESEVFLINCTASGILIIIGLAIESITAALLAILGAFIAMLSILLLKADHSAIYLGLYTFNSVLVAIAVGSTFNKPSIPTFIYTLVAVISVIFIQGAIDTVVLPWGITGLTMPFVLTTWLFFKYKR